MLTRTPISRRGTKLDTTSHATRYTTVARFPSRSPGSVKATLPPATSYFLFFTDDTTCSVPQPQISSVHSYVTVPHHLHHTPRLYPRYPRSLHRPMTHTDPQARPHHSRIRDTATPYDIGPSSCCFISMPFRLFRAGNEVFPCYLEISFPQLHPRSQDSHTVPGHS